MTTREQRLRELCDKWRNPKWEATNDDEQGFLECLGYCADELAAILAEPVEVSDASDDEVRQWADRHDLQLSITSAREVFEDAQTFHMLKARKEPGQ